MPNYRRWYVPGGTVFFTVVTNRRHKLFASGQARHLLGDAMRSIRNEMPFQTISSVLLHDHLHAIWTLPVGDEDYSTRWKRIKRDFTVLWLAAGGQAPAVTNSQDRRGGRGVWQKRFYERQVRDELELESLCDYIHYNPVKHGYVKSPCDWPHSTFHRFVQRGQYPLHWGSSEPLSIAPLDFE